jgi:hypothetical protein
MHEPAAERRQHTPRFWGRPVGITIHLEYRVRAVSDRRRRTRRLSGRWPYHERRRRARRQADRRHRSQRHLAEAALEILSRVAVFDESARRALAQLRAQLSAGMQPAPESNAAERARAGGNGPCAGR